MPIRLIENEGPCFDGYCSVIVDVAPTLEEVNLDTLAEALRAWLSSQEWELDLDGEWLEVGTWWHRHLVVRAPGMSDDDVYDATVVATDTALIEYDCSPGEPWFVAKMQVGITVTKTGDWFTFRVLGGVALQKF